MTLSESVRVLLPPEMPKSNIVVKELSSSFQATWGNPVAIKVKVTYKEAGGLGWQPGDILMSRQPTYGSVPIELATRLVQQVHAFVYAQESAKANAALREAVQATVSGVAAASREAVPVPGLAELAHTAAVAAVASMQETAQANGTSELPEEEIEAEIAVTRAERREEKHQLFGERYAADPATVHAALTTAVGQVEHAVTLLKPDTSIGWIARQVATFPEFRSHMASTTDALYPSEREALRSWAAKQDGLSGRGEIIRTLLAQEEINAELNDKLRTAGLDLDAVAEEIETLVDGSKSFGEIVDRLKKCIERLETAAREARK